MAVRVGINGFGRIGRQSLKALIERTPDVEVVNPTKITMKNGKPALSGTCPICKGKVFKIGG